MILDAIIVFLAPLFMAVGHGVALIVVPILNGLAWIAETITGFFIDGFTLGRVDRKNSKTSPLVGTITVALLLVVLVWVFVAPKFLNREINFVATDGHPLPLAAVIVHRSGGEDIIRTDTTGKVTVPRFGLHSVTIKDPRYVEQTWERKQLEPTLTVRRTVLGAGLDVLADRLLKPAKEDQKDEK